ncbi:Bacteriohemerythrin [compost metagenome]
MGDIDWLEWHDGLLTGHAAIDEEHRTFARLISTLSEVPDVGLLDALEAALEAARAHFGHEDKVMEDTQFPPRGCHMGEHTAVLASMTAVRARLTRGETQPARLLAAELTRWFPAHVQHLDSALAHWIFKQSVNAKPLVFRRSLGSSIQEAA